MKPLLPTIWIGLCVGCARDVPIGFEQSCEADDECPEGLVCAERNPDEELLGPECQIPCETKRDCPTHDGRWLCNDEGFCDYYFPK